MRNSSVTLVVCSLLLIGFHTVAEAKRQDEGAEQSARITSIEVKGNSVQNSTSIVSYAGIKIGDRATRAALFEAQRGILKSGYFGMRRDQPEDTVKLMVAEFNKATNEAKLIISVEENEVVKSINIKGNGSVSKKELLSHIRTQPGFVLNVNMLRADVERIQKSYDSKGYLAQISDEGFGLKDGVLNIPVVVGKVGTVTFKGLSEAKREAVEREWNRMFKPGDYYNAMMFRDLIKKLKKMGIEQDMNDIAAGNVSYPKPDQGVLVTLNLREKK